MAKTTQVQSTRFARGVRLTLQNAVGEDASHGLQGMATLAAQAGAADTVEDLGVCKFDYLIPYVGAQAAEAQLPVAYLPFLLPPFQQDFQYAGTVGDYTTLEDPQYRCKLDELSLSLDQRGEPFGITSPYSSSAPGLLTAADMNRLDMTLRLLQRTPTRVATPTLVNAEVIALKEVLKLEIDGVEAFGIGSPESGALSRTNPLCVPNLGITLDPFSVYVWEVSCPGLYSAAGVAPGATVELLALVSWHLVCTILSPLTVRDTTIDAVDIQNMPTIHQGGATGETIPLAIPVGGDPITGDDVQAQQHGFDRALRQRGGSGYGVGFGALGNDMQAAQNPPVSLLRNDAHYHCIMVPLWGGQFRDSVRQGDVATAGLPYVDPATGIGPTADRREIPVPDNFVLHHAFAVWNCYSPISVVGGHPGNPAWPNVAATGYTQSVGIGLNSGWEADDYRYQQVAFVNWNPSAGAVGAVPSYQTFLIDELQALSLLGILNPVYRILQIPLVRPTAAAAWSAHSYLESGVPVFMGKANTMTQPRNTMASMPRYVAGSVAANLTDGKENTLEVTWVKDFNGFAGMGATDVLIGGGGEWVVLVGRMTVGG